MLASSLMLASSHQEISTTEKYYSQHKTRWVHKAESVRPNTDGRINKNQMAKNFDQTAETEGPKITTRKKNEQV